MVVVVDVVVDPVLLVPAAVVLDPPPPQPPEAPRIAAKDSVAANRETDGGKKPRVEKVCTQASQITLATAIGL